MPRRRTGGITADVQGVRELRGRLEDLEDDLLDACKRAIAASAEAVKEDIETNVPVDTGHLRDNVRIRERDEGLTAHVGWFDDNSYYAIFLEHGTKSIPARPVLQPALERERTQLTDRVRDEVRQAVRRR